LASSTLVTVKNVETFRAKVILLNYECQRNVIFFVYRILLTAVYL